MKPIKIVYDMQLKLNGNKAKAITYSLEALDHDDVVPSYMGVRRPPDMCLLHRKDAVSAVV